MNENFKFKKDRPFAPEGEYAMTYQGPVRVENQFGGHTLEQRFSNADYQAKILTPVAWREGNNLDAFIAEMTGKKFAIDDQIDLRELVGKRFRVVVKEVNGVPRLDSVAPVKEV